MTRKRTARRALITGVLGSLLMVGCSGSDTRSSSSSTATGVGGTAPTTDGRSDGVYLVQQAGAASLGPLDSGGTATLTLTGAVERTVYFTPAASRRAGSAPTAGVVDVLNGSAQPHEAALSWRTPNGPGTLVVTIESGAYDEATRELTYRVRPIDPAQLNSTSVAAHAGADARARASAPQLPDGITSSTLFVDPLGEDRAVATCNLTIANESADAMEVTSINSQDFGGMVDWDTKIVRGQIIGAGSRAVANSGASFVDCHADLTFSVGSGGSSTMELQFENSVFDSSDWTCQVSGPFTCTVVANAKGQPMDMTVTLTD